MKIGIVGLGYVGCTGMVGYAELGHTVVGVDVVAEKVKAINDGRSPIAEPGISDLLKRYVSSGAVRATTELRPVIATADVLIVCVGTPSKRDGFVDTSQLERAMMEISVLRRHTGNHIPVLVRSTALPETHRKLIKILDEGSAADVPVEYCVHPEYLREGQSLADFSSPPKIVFGCTDNKIEGVCKELYPKMRWQPTVYTSPEVAALTKYVDNAFHSVKITFANEIGMLCKVQGVDSRAVMDLLCKDRVLNISTAYLDPGAPFGGSCLPKDLRALTAFGRMHGVASPFLESVLESNRLQMDRIVVDVLSTGCKNVGIFGLAFKEHTDDLRESPMVHIAETLLGKGMRVRVWDPILSVERLIGGNLDYAMLYLPHLKDMVVEDPHVVVEKSEVVIMSQQCDEELPWRMDQVVFDLIGADLPGAGVPPNVKGLYWKDHNATK